jgi:HSP20 family protein
MAILKKSKEREGTNGHGQALVRRRSRTTTPTTVDPLSRLFGGLGPFGLFSNLGTGLLGTTRQPAVDILDRGNEYEVRVELPGVAREDVEINVSEGSLEISAESTTEAEKADRGYYQREIGTQSFFRSLPLPPEADPDNVEARLENGVLFVTLGKTEDAGRRRRNVPVR